METPQRRFFIQEMMKRVTRLAADIHSAYRVGSNDVCAEDDTDEQYFKSFENCYPLISEYAYFMDEEVDKLGINTNGLTLEKIAEKIYTNSRECK